ncbi:unnamed protein product [Dibothriocephalus latus]|uniref:Uncharacterized protein n=1 Tax=Dibothriocephalus latus TaxID=60516 RepID=A0A3P7LS71_DIBLA|nr:unnamed protein product [Dibothriocephalus latus]
MENVALSLSLLYELSLGEKSIWCDYLCKRFTCLLFKWYSPLDSLPMSYSTVMYLSAEQMELLSGFPTAGRIACPTKPLWQYAYFFLLFEKMDTLLGNMKFFCFADYRLINQLGVLLVMNSDVWWVDYL